MYKKQLVKATTMKDVKKLYPKAQKTSEVHGAKFYIELDKSKKLYAGAYSKNTMKSVEPFKIEAVYVMKGKNPEYLFRESVQPIKLKDILSEIEEVSDDSIIKYKDKDGESKEMPAKSAKTMPHEHPAKKAWDTENEKSQGGGAEKPDPNKLSGSDFQRKGDGAQVVNRKLKPKTKPTPMDNDEDTAFEYEDSIATGGGFEDVQFDDFDMSGNPIYMATNKDGDDVEITVDQETGEIYDYDDNYKTGFKPTRYGTYAYGNVNEQTYNRGNIMNNEQEKMLKKIISESNTPGYENRKFGDSLPTLASVKKAYDKKNGIKEEDSVEEAAPRMKVTRYQKELDQAMQSIIRAQNMMALDQPGQYKRVDKAFIKIKKQFMQFKGAVNTVG